MRNQHLILRSREAASRRMRPHRQPSMPRPNNKRSLTIARHRTSVSLEDEFWDALADIARADGKSVAALIGEIDKGRSETAGSQPSLPAGTPPPFVHARGWGGLREC